MRVVVQRDMVVGQGGDLVHFPAPLIRQGRMAFRPRLCRPPLSSRKIEVLARRFSLIHSMDVTPLNPVPVKITDHNDYAAEGISPNTVCASPFEQFTKWFDEARHPKNGRPIVTEPEAMSLATADSQGVPSVRMVLLKQVDDKGFLFFTNYNSRKSQELAVNPNAAISFYWKEVSRQIRAVGRVERVSDDESTAYYDSRPIGSRIGAWASPQSSVIQEGDLDKNVLEVKRKFDELDEHSAGIPRPTFWGGWRLIPQ